MKNKLAWDWTCLTDLPNSLRRIGFYAYDALRHRGSVHTAIAELQIVNSLGADSVQLQDYHRNALTQLLTHARLTTRFYAEQGGVPFRELPVVNKAKIRERSSDFRSSDGQFQSMRKMKTSGSTGTPFGVDQDRRKVERTRAEVIYYFQEVGYRVGDPLTNFTPASKSYGRSRLRSIATNENRIGILGASKDQAALVYAGMLSRSGVTVLGLPNMFELVEAYSPRGSSSLSGTVNAIVSSGSVITNRTRRTLRERFGCPVVSRYSNQENGVLGQDTTIDNVFEINQANYLVEILDADSDSPVSDGSPGRVVITDLYNYAQPMIRYDTGDIAAIETREINGIPRRVLVDLAGRKYDTLFDLRGTPILANSLVNQIVDLLPAVQQIQFIQEARDRFRLRVNGHIDAKKSLQVQELVVEFFGHGANLSIDEVSELPVLSSGKRQTVVSEWSPGQDT